MLGPGFTRDFFRPFAWTRWQPWEGPGNTTIYDKLWRTSCEMLRRLSSTSFIHLSRIYPFVHLVRPCMRPSILHAWKWCQLMGKRDRAGTGVNPWFPRAVRVDPLGYATENLLKGRAARRSWARAMADNELRNAARCLHVAGAQLVSTTLPGRWGMCFSGFCSLDFPSFLQKFIAIFSPFTS